MKIKIRPDDPSMVQKHGLTQMGHRLAELGADSRTEPPGHGHAETNSADDPWSEVLAQADALAEARARAQAEATPGPGPMPPGARAEADARAQADALADARARAQADALADARARAQADALADARARAEADARAQAGARAEADNAARGGAAVRAVIGDQLRMPIMWCEMGSCISWYADPAALGEADTRARAIGAGWRIDALGRLACPRCQQSDPGFWASCPVVPCDRDMATAWAGALPGDRTAGSAAAEISRDLGLVASGYPPASRGGLELHHDVPAAEVMPAGKRAEDPASTVILAARS